MQSFAEQGPRSVEACGCMEVDLCEGCPQRERQELAARLRADLEAQDLCLRVIASGAPCRLKQNLKKNQHETTEVRSLLDQLIIDGTAEQWARLRAVGEALGS